jgi:hypothetical protein
MAFTYDDALTADRDRVRFALQDTEIDSGPKPGNGNFSDNELSGLVTLEGEWQRAVAAGFEALAAIWTQYADLGEGPHKETLSQIAEGHRKSAALWRARSGSVTPARVAGIIKVDGYSDDITSDDVDTSSEYGIVWEYVRVRE